jgi:hypothetical protein
MAKTYLRLMAPDSGLRRVILRRRSNSDMGRDRKHLTELEVERLIKVAKGNRHGQRDASHNPDRLPSRSPTCSGQGQHHLCAPRQGRSGSNTLKRQSASPLRVCLRTARSVHCLGMCQAAGARRKPRSVLRYTRTCFGMQRLRVGQIRAWIRQRCRPIWVIGRSIRRRAMPRLPLAGSKTSGGGRRGAGAMYYCR